MLISKSMQDINSDINEQIKGAIISKERIVSKDTAMFKG